MKVNSNEYIKNIDFKDIGLFWADLNVGKEYNPFFGAQVFAVFQCDALTLDGESVGGVDYNKLVNCHIADKLVELRNKCVFIFSKLASRIDAERNNERFVANIVVWSLMNRTDILSDTLPEALPAVPVYDKCFIHDLYKIDAETLNELNICLSEVKRMAYNLLEEVNTSKGIDPKVATILKIYLEAI